MLKHKYNIPDMLASIIGYKGIPYPGGFLPKRPEGSYSVDDPNIDTEPVAMQELVKGTRLRKRGEYGVWYFMPVSFRHNAIKNADNTLEFTDAVINITGQKTIIDTPMVGRKGAVKELINIDDYEIEIAAFVHTNDGTYPEALITQVRDLFNINEAVEIISVFTDLILDEGDRVVIKNIEFPATPGVEDGQAIRLECVTDKEFELIIS